MHHREILVFHITEDTTVDREKHSQCPTTPLPTSLTDFRIADLTDPSVRPRRE